MSDAKDAFDDASKWPLAAYGTVIRGDESTSEDQVGSACSPEVARRFVACVNACRGLSTDELDKGGVVAKTRFDAVLEAMRVLAGTLDELSQEDAVSSLKGGAAGIASGIRKSIIKIMGAAPAAKDNV